MAMVFESKRDWWIVALIWFGVVLSALGALVMLIGPASFLFRALMLVVLIGAAGFSLWVFYRTDYTLTDETLLIRCGPFHYRVPLAEIDLVKPSRNPLSSPACSLDRLLIKWDDESKRILISPSRKADFLRELDRRCAQLKLDGDRLVK
jgi:hypothetical protein